MRIALLDIRHNSLLPENSSMISMRNLLELAYELPADLIYSKNKIPMTAYDVIICGFASQFSEYDESIKFLDRNKDAKIFWLCSEYEQGMFPAIHYAIIKKNRKLQIIQNYEKIREKEYIEKTHILNLNLLIMRKANNEVNKKYDCIYYGRWRPDREKYFKKYLNEDIFLSSSNKNFKLYKNIGCNPRYIKKMTWGKKRETLNLFRYSLYIEDEYTHTVFNNLGNRWYEAGICNCVVFFDASCRNTILKSEIGEHIKEIEDYIVTDYAALQKKIAACNEDFEKHLAVQKNWRKKEMACREEVVNKIKSIVGIY